VSIFKQTPSALTSYTDTVAWAYPTAADATTVLTDAASTLLTQTLKEL
jgi:hypothetical protein